MKKTAFLCLMLAAVLYFAGSFWQPLSLGQYGVFGYASARDMTGLQETDQMPGLSDESQEDQEGSRTDKAGGLSEKGIPPADFEIIRQMPELPTGCEITALTMMLNYYGYSVDKMTMASEYLPVIPAEFYEGADGRVYGPDMDNFFVGDPSASGYICGTGAIRSAADAYLEDRDSALRAKDLTGTPLPELYALVRDGTPVLVWVTIGMAERDEVQGWYTADGRWMEWSRNDHGAVLIGCSNDMVTIADPLSGLRVYSRDRFEHVFASRGSQCVALFMQES